MLSRDQIQEIRAREQAATPGPWGITGSFNQLFDQKTDDDSDISTVIGEVWGIHGEPRPARKAQREADIDFIAHSRQDIPALLDHIEEVEAERDALQAKYDEPNNFEQTQCRVLLEQNARLQKELPRLARESVEREKTLAQLECEVKAGMEINARLQKERDAAVRDLEISLLTHANLCECCKHDVTARCMDCGVDTEESPKPILWQWRGLQEEEK